MRPLSVRDRGRAGRAFQELDGQPDGVLSPAAAKFVLNTILVATHFVVKGIRLFGYEPTDVAHTWRQICSLVFADDWLSAIYVQRDRGAQSTVTVDQLGGNHGQQAGHQGARQDRAHRHRL